MTDIALYIAHVVLFFFLGRKYGADIIEGLQGDNNKFDAPEVITGLWIVAFIIISGLNITIFANPPAIPGLLLWLFIALLVFYIPLREIYNKTKK